MQKNPKLLIVIGGICLLLIIGLLWSGAKQSKSSSNKTKTTQQLIKDKASGDTENEVLRTVLANQEQLKSENKKLKEQNEGLQQKGMKTIDDLIQTSKQKLQDEVSGLKSTFETKLEDQQKTISDLENKNNNEKNKQGGFEIGGGQTWNSEGVDSKPHVITSVSDLSSDLSDSSGKGKISDAQSNTSASDGSPALPSDLEKSQTAGNLNNQAGQDKNIIPYYTMPANSTINHVKLMTSIIGEVPVSGKLVAPAFPFKAIIGRKDLYAANGMSLPSDLAGTILQGYSVGNMTLSCARMYVTRILFVFNDGHFVVYPKESDNEGATSLYPKNALGYLSDSYGNTCLVGKYITDAPKVLTNLALLGGISTGANAVAASQFTTMNNGQSFTTALTGSMPKLVGASMVGGGADEVLKWYKERVDDVFDAVYIPASFHHRPTNLVFNITKTIPIDLDKKGRTLRYENASALSDNFKKLD
jgi:integrating conjugative element protein (TIGR03752 family)